MYPILREHQELDLKCFVLKGAWKKEGKTEAGIFRLELIPGRGRIQLFWL
jgi:hypothetical protein